VAAYMGCVAYWILLDEALSQNADFGMAPSVPCHVDRSRCICCVLSSYPVPCIMAVES